MSPAAAERYQQFDALFGEGRGGTRGDEPELSVSPVDSLLARLFGTERLPSGLTVLHSGHPDAGRTLFAAAIAVAMTAFGEVAYLDCDQGNVQQLLAAQRPVTEPMYLTASSGLGVTMVEQLLNSSMAAVIIDSLNFAPPSGLVTPTSALVKVVDRLGRAVQQTQTPLLVTYRASGGSQLPRELDALASTRLLVESQGNGDQRRYQASNAQAGLSARLCLGEDLSLDLA